MHLQTLHLAGFILIGLAAVAAPVRAQSPGAPAEAGVVSATTTATLAQPRVEALPSSGTLRLLRTLETFHRSVKSIHGTFRQVRVDEVFVDRVESDGELWFRKPYEFRCNYADPQPMILLILKQALYTYIPELNQADYWRFESDEKRDQQLHQLVIGFGCDVGELVKTYEIHSSEDEPEPIKELAAANLDSGKKALFIFTPRPEYLDTSPFLLLKLTIDKASLLPEKIWYQDHNDANMTLTMRKIETDVPLGEDLFDVGKVIPPGTEIIDKRKTP